MDKTEALLSQLRDIHLPAPIANWPWATARYVTLSALVIALLVGLFFVWRVAQKKQKKQRLLQQFETLYQDNNFAELSVLLKRVALKAYPNEDVAGLHDQAWLDFLDRTRDKNSSQQFKSSAGELLLELPYRKSVEDVELEKREALFSLVKNWLVKNV
jgi:hypothetical protein